MSASDPIQLLRGSRAALLACEVIGWLHMAGKAHPQFVRQQARDAVVNDPSSDWPELKWADNLYARMRSIPNIGGQEIAPKTLFEKHRCRSDGVLGLLQAAHGMASGIEKNAPAAYQKQPLGETWLTTAFGDPVHNLLARRPWVLADDAWPRLEQRIGALLDGLGACIKAPDDVTAWHTWRDDAIGPDGWLREAFSATLAETRVPNNDVTLWDQSYIAAALFKAAVAGAVLTGSGFEWGNGIKQNTQWRVLTVGIGAEHYASCAVRIGDWTGTREEIHAFFDDVCRLVEIDLAIGACAYRDERVLAFTFPGQRLDKKPSLADDIADMLLRDIESLVDEQAQELDFETPPRVELSCRSTRSFIDMARELRRAREALDVPLHRPWSIRDDGSHGRHVCPVSLVRPGAPQFQEDKGKLTENDRKKVVSQACYGRRTGRRESWEQRGGDTIWITEVADENDRVALLTFSLDIEPWLDGSRVDSLRAQSVATWSAHVSLSKGVSTPTTQAELTALLQTALPKKGNESTKIRGQLLGKLSDGFEEADWPSPFYERLVVDRADAPAWDALANPERAAWLAHQLFRKNASPGRVHRFWRTTEGFFREALEELRKVASSHTNPWRTRRLGLAANASLRDGEVYAGRLPMVPDAPFEVLHRNTLGGLVTVCNLARIMKVDGAPASLLGQMFKAKGDDGTSHELVVGPAKDAPSPLGSYTPLIVLEENPERFRMLVPLSQAEACVAHVIDKWRREMARVWDRLPLRVGVVAFPRKMPFQAVIEATRNIEDGFAARDLEMWRVDQVEQREHEAAVWFVRPDGEHQLVTVPTKLADGRDDVYYPNVAVQGETPPKQHDFVAPRQGEASTVYRWAPELQPGDSVIVAPARCASVFLDTTARRFDPVEVRYLSDWQRERDIWRLVEAHAGSTSAARAVEASVREARERWADTQDGRNDAAWLPFVRATLANEWNARDAELDALVEAVRTRCLQHALSWNLHVLKRKLESKT